MPSGASTSSQVRKWQAGKVRSCQLSDSGHKARRLPLAQMRSAGCIGRCPVSGATGSHLLTPNSSQIDRGIEKTSASFEARSASRSYPTKRDIGEASILRIQNPSDTGGRIAFQARPTREAWLFVPTEALAVTSALDGPDPSVPLNGKDARLSISQNLCSCILRGPHSFGLCACIFLGRPILKLFQQGSRCCRPDFCLALMGGIKSGSNFVAGRRAPYSLSVSS
jgi:hypothetical protein